MRQGESVAEFDERIKDGRPATDEQIQHALEQFLPLYATRMLQVEKGIRQMEGGAAQSHTVYRSY